MPSALDDRTILQHQDLVGIDHRGQSMRNHQRRVSAGYLLERRLDLAFGLRIERGRCLVEDQDPRVLENGARDRHALLLPP